MNNRKRITNEVTFWLFCLLRIIYCASGNWTLPRGDCHERAMSTEKTA